MLSIVRVARFSDLFAKFKKATQFNRVAHSSLQMVKVMLGPDAA